MSKLEKLKEITEEGVDIFKDHPRKCLTLLLTIVLLLYTLGWTTVNRVPPAIGCLWEAKLTYSLSGDDWRYQWIVNKCQRKRSDGVWVGLDSAKDAAGLE